MLDQQAILNCLRQIADDFRSVKVINSYCGMPITQETTIRAVTDSEAILGVNEYQAVCMLVEGKTFLQCEGLPEAIRAKVERVDIQKKEAAVSRFSGAGDTIGKRIAGRIHPKETLEASIVVDGFQLTGKIADLSTRSIGILAQASEIPASLSLERQAQAAIAFQLPGAEQPLTAPGTIASFAYQPDTSTVRLGFQLTPSSETEDRLINYFFDRRDEVMHELSLIYDSMRRELKYAG